MTIIDDNTRSSSKQAGSLSTPCTGKPVWMKIGENISQNGQVGIEPPCADFAQVLFSVVENLFSKRSNRSRVRT